MPAFTRSLFFLLAAVVCIAIALLLTLTVLTGGNATAWAYGSLLAFYLSHAPLERTP